VRAKPANFEYHIIGHNLLHINFSNYFVARMITLLGIPIIYNNILMSTLQIELGLSICYYGT